MENVSHESARSSGLGVAGVSWGAIFAGAVSAAALFMLLILLGVGFGLASIPWSDGAPDLQVLGISTIVWLTLSQIIALGLGGYLAGRLRVKWAGIRTDEVFFRDTAHGLITWSVATVVLVFMLLSGMGAILGAGVQAGTAAAGGVADVAGAAEDADPTQYVVDLMLRADPQTEPVDEQASEQLRGEMTAILTRSAVQGEMTTDDAEYMSAQIAQYTNLSQQEALERVSEVYSQAQEAMGQAGAAAEEAAAAAAEAAEAAAEGVAYAALWLCIVLLFGALTASYLATVGGRQRDAVEF